MEGSPIPFSPQSQPLSVGKDRVMRATLHWWVEIQTTVPLCTYYFGPFETQQEARDARTGYVEDLHCEGARDIIAVVKQCQPNILTLDRGYDRHSAPSTVTS